MHLRTKVHSIEGVFDADHRYGFLFALWCFLTEKQAFKRKTPTLFGWCNEHSKWFISTLFRWCNSSWKYFSLPSFEAATGSMNLTLPSFVDASVYGNIFLYPLWKLQLEGWIVLHPLSSMQYTCQVFFSTFSLCCIYNDITYFTRVETPK